MDASVTPVDRVLHIATAQFADFGYRETKIEKICQLAGVSKRLIPYHFGDKYGLYLACLSAAAQAIIPPLSQLAGSQLAPNAVPGDAMRHVVEALFEHHINHPAQLRLLSTWHQPSTETTTVVAPLTDPNALILHLERVLMLGQEAGAFRPGISANDIFSLVLALSTHQVMGASLSTNIFGVDLTNPTAIAGLRRLAGDTVLALLTAHLPDSGQPCYIPVAAPTTATPATSDDADGGIYSDIYR